MFKKTIYKITLIALLGLFALYGCKKNDGSKKDKVEENHVLSVATTTVEEGLVSDDDTFSSVVMPLTSNNITSQTGGRLERLYVNIGDRVHRGQVLATMDASQLNQLKVRLDNAKIDYSRADELYKVGGISKSQWEQARSQMSILSEQYSDLQNNTILKSPTNGIVTARNYDVGDMTSVQLPILVVQDMSVVKMILKVSEKYYSMLRKDMPVKVTVDAISGKTFEGYVYNIYPTIDENTHSVTVEVRVDNKLRELRPGMFAKVFIKFADVKSLLVPDMSVMTQLGSGQKIVYLYKNAEAIARVVEVGRIVGDKYQILSGLNLGDTVITSQINALSSGMKVEKLIEK